MRVKCFGAKRRKKLIVSVGFGVKRRENWLFRVSVLFSARSTEKNRISFSGMFSFSISLFWGNVLFFSKFFFKCFGGKRRKIVSFGSIFAGKFELVFQGCFVGTNDRLHLPHICYIYLQSHTTHLQYWLLDLWPASYWLLVSLVTITCTYSYTSPPGCTL